MSNKYRSTSSIAAQPIKSFNKRRCSVPEEVSLEEDSVDSYNNSEANDGKDVPSDDDDDALNNSYFDMAAGSTR